MGILVQKGTFEKGTTTEGNSLVANLNKYPEISQVLTDLYPQYQFYWLFEKLNMFSGEQVQKDNSFEYKVRGRLDAPLISAGGIVAKGGPSAYEDLSAYTTLALATPGQVATDDCILFKAKDNAAADAFIWANPQDILMFQSGAQVIVWDIIGSGTAALGTDPDLVIGANEVGIICKVIYGQPTVADLAADATIANIGDAYGEGSNGGYQNKVRETTKRNWLTKTRRSYDITGDAMTNVSWINYQGAALWYYSEEEDTEKIFKYQAEKRARFARRSMDVLSSGATDPSGSNIYPGGGGQNLLTWKDNGDNKNDKAPEIGDGLFPQFDGGNLASYTMGTGGNNLGETFLQAYMARLAQHSPKGAEGNSWLVLAGSMGRVQFANAMKQLVIGGTAGGSFTDLKTGQDMALGTNFTTYHTLGNSITLVQDYTLDDKNIYGEDLDLNAGAIKLSGSGDLKFVNFDNGARGEANIMFRSKYQRSYISRYLPGMMNPYSQESGGMAVTGFDGFSREWLAHGGVILRNGLTCGEVLGV